MAENIKVSIELADAAAQKSLNDFITKSKKVDDGFKKVKESGQGTFSEISVGIGKSIGVYEIFAGNISANLALKGLELLKQGASALFDTFIVEGVKAAEESEKALNALNTALALSGNYSETSSKKIQDFAKEIQKTTAFEDDMVIKNVALLQSLTKLDTEGLTRVSRAAINLSAVLGRDLGTVTEALAKASNGNVTALKKMGITFEETGSKSQDFKNALVAIENKFGGGAVASVNTFGGSLSQLKNNFGDLLEEIGNVVIKNPLVISTIKTLTDTMVRFSEYISANSGKISEMMTGWIANFIEGAKKVAPVLDIIITTLGVLGDTVKVLYNAGSLTAKGLLFDFDGVVEDLKDIGNGFSNIGNTINAKLQSGTFGTISDAVNKMGTDIIESSKNMAVASEQNVISLQKSRVATVELTEEQQRLRQEDVKYVEGLAKKSADIEANQKLELDLLASKLELRNALEADKDKVNYENKLIAEQQFADAEQQVLYDNLQKAETRVINSIASEEQKNAALLALENKYQLESNKAKNEADVRDIKRSKEKKEKEKKDREDTISTTANTFGALASLAAIGGKKNFEIMKAFSLAEALTSGYLAAQKALALGYPMAIPATIAAAATTAANVARITSQQPPSFENGGIVPGSSFTGDRISANVNSGEMILNRRQQSQLFDMVNNGGVAASVSGLGSSIGQVVKDIMSQPIIVNVDGKQLFNITRDQLANGRSF